MSLVICNILKIVTPTLTQVLGNGGDNLALNMLACDCMFNYAFKGLIVVLDDQSIQDLSARFQTWNLTYPAALHDYQCGP